MEIEEKIKIICSDETAEALERYFKWAKDYRCFKKNMTVYFPVPDKDGKKDKLKELLWDNYYFFAILIVPYSIEVLHGIAEERDFVIFSQRLARHHIYFFNWCDKPDPMERLVELLKKEKKD